MFAQLKSVLLINIRHDLFRRLRFSHRRKSILISHRTLSGISIHIFRYQRGDLIFLNSIRKSFSIICDDGET